MSPVDEGLIHAWLDGQLAPGDAARVEELVATDAAWGAAAAEARGLVAASSRILGALDDVPSIRSAGGAPVASASRSARWRSPWLRAAAGIVLAVGVTSVVLRQMPGIPAADELKELGDRPSVAAPVIAAPPAVAQPEARPAPPPGGEVRQRPGRDQAAASKSETRADDRRAAVGGTAGDTVSSGGATRGKVAANGIVAAPKPPPAVERDLVAGLRAPPRADTTTRAMDATAKTAALSAFASVDARLVGCWAPVDSSQRFRDGGQFMLRFVGPAITDVIETTGRAAAGGGRGGRTGAGRQTNAATPPASAATAPVGTLSRARVQNAPVRMLADSSYVTEWIATDGRTTLSFTVRGDTLRGTSRLSAGDVGFSAQPFSAMRTVCPP